MSVAVAFPGMGPLAPVDVAKYLLVDRDARELRAEADEVLGYDLFDRFCRPAGDDPADYSEPAQVAFLVVCLAMARWSVRHGGPVATLCTGASFGGKAAAVHSGALSLADGVRLTAELARIEADYFATEHSEVVTQSFARTPPAAVAAIMSELAADGEWHEISCEVDDDLAMLSLSESRLVWLAERVRAAGGIPLYTMRPPMHCSIFTRLRDRVAEQAFGSLTFHDPAIPVVADQDGSVRESADGVRRMLLDGFVAPVRWPRVVATLQERGVTQLMVAGPDTLFGRVPVTTSAFAVSILHPRLALMPRRRSPDAAQAG